MSEQPHNKSPKSELFQDKPCESPEAVHYKMDSPEQWTAEIERLKAKLVEAMTDAADECRARDIKIELLNRRDMLRMDTIELLGKEIDQLKKQNQKLAEEKLKYNVDWNRIQQLEAEIEGLRADLESRTSTANMRYGQILANREAIEQLEARILKKERDWQRLKEWLPGPDNGVNANSWIAITDKMREIEEE